MLGKAILTGLLKHALPNTALVGRFGDALTSCHCEERFCDEAISYFAAVKNEIASSFHSSQRPVLKLAVFVSKQCTPPHNPPTESALHHLAISPHGEMFLHWSSRK